MGEASSPRSPPSTMAEDKATKKVCFWHDYPGSGDHMMVVDH